MRTEHLEYFLKLAQTNSITQAAKELYTTHQNVSKIIRQLEEDLGTTLFLRNQKGVALTPTGQLLLPVAQRTFTDFSQLRKDITALEKRPHLTGALQIFSSDTVSYSMLSNVIQIFSDLYPDLSIHLHNTDALTILQEVALHPTRIGITAVLSNPEFQHLYEPYLQQVNLYPLIQDTYYCLVGNSSPLAELKSISLAQFVQYPYIATTVNDEGENALTRLVTERGGSVAFSTNDILTYIDMVGKRNYVAFTSGLTKKKNTGSTVFTEAKMLPLQEDMRLHIVLVTNRQAQLDQASQTFVDFIKNCHIYL